MKVLTLKSYYCESCRMPSLPGLCELCANKFKLAGELSEPGSKARHILILSAIFAIALVVLVVGFTKAI